MLDFNGGIRMHTWFKLYAYIHTHFLIISTKRPNNNDIPVAMSTPGT